MQRFIPTHEITHNGRVILVCDPDGLGAPCVLYTRAEWDADDCADWEVEENGTLTFQGGVPAGECSIRKIQADGVVRCQASPTGWVKLLPAALRKYDPDKITAEDIACDASISTFDASDVAALIGSDEPARLEASQEEDPDAPEPYAVQTEDDIIGCGKTPDEALADARATVAAWERELQERRQPERRREILQGALTRAIPGAKLVHEPDRAYEFAVRLDETVQNVRGEDVALLSYADTAEQAVSRAIQERLAMRLESRAEVISAIVHSLRNDGASTPLMPWTADRAEAAEKAIAEEGGSKTELDGMVEYFGAPGNGWRIALER